MNDNKTDNTKLWCCIIAYYLIGTIIGLLSITYQFQEGKVVSIILLASIPLITIELMRMMR